MRFYRLFCFIVFLGPFKILLFALCFFFFFFVISILPLFRPFFKTARAFKTWANSVVRPIIRVALLSLGIIKITVNGTIHPYARTFVCNHLALIETVVLLHEIPLSYLAADYLAKHPFIQMTSHVFDFVFVNRSRNGGISQHLIDIANDPSLLPVMVFPEGKVSNGDAVIGFRSGAFLSETLVQPLAVRFRMWLTPKSMSTVSWNEDNFKKYVYQLFAIPFMTVELTALEPIVWKGSEKNAQERAADSQLQIANYLGVVACSRTNKDLFHPHTD
jgi:lysophosphatidylcholine acyltransferase/lyso-PAF acetyltransferase